MSRIKYLFVLSFLLALVCCKSGSPPDFENNIIPVTSIRNLPETKDYVTDLANMLSVEQEQILSSLLADYEKETSREIAVITLDSITPYTDIIEFGKDLGNYWQVGKKDKDNGLIIILDQSQRNVGIATGLSTERILTDSICQEVINQFMVPEFRNGKFFEGVKAGINELVKIWE